MNRTHRIAVLSVLMLAPAAQGQLMGEMLDAEWIYPSPGSVLEGHVVTVTGAVELPNTAIVNDSKFEIDIGEDWIEFRFNANSNWSSTAFNGWLFRDSAGTIPDFEAYSIDSFSAGVTNTAGIALGFNADEVWANFAGMTVAGSGDWIRLKIDIGAVAMGFCFGDGSDSGCPCGNFGVPGEGCVNSTAVGAILTSSGTIVASTDDFVLTGAQLPSGVPSLFFSGTTAIQPATLFGDGLRCAGGTLTRLEIVFAGPGGDATTSVGIASTLGATAGTHSVFQLWYRDPVGPCNGGFNTTGAIDVTWR